MKKKRKERHVKYTYKYLQKGGKTIVIMSRIVLLPEAFQVAESSLIPALPSILVSQSAQGIFMTQCASDTASPDLSAVTCLYALRSPRFISPSIMSYDYVQYFAKGLIQRD